MQGLLQDFKSGEFQQINLLCGEETYLRKQYRDRLKEALCDDPEGMNVNCFEGKDTNIRELIDLAETLPFFADRRVIVAENTGWLSKGGEELADYLSRLPETTFLILVEEQVLSRLSPRQRARRVAILPQRMAVPHITVKEMTAFGRNPYLDFTGRLSAGDRQAVMEALEFSDALSLAERYVDTLSGGERQRAALAMVLAQNTPILLLDEPTAHMDPAYEAQFLARLRELKRRGKTILVVLHDLTQAVAYGDRLVVLDGGTVVFSGTKEVCLAGQILEKTFSLRRYTVSEGSHEKLFFSSYE